MSRSMISSSVISPETISARVDRDAALAESAEDHRGEGNHPLAEIVSGRFAEDLGALPEIEDVVDDLERHAQVGAETAQLLHGVLIGPADHGAHLGRAGKEGGRFSVDPALVVVAALAHPVGIEGFSDLAIADFGERCRENGDDARVVAGSGENGALGEQVVADQDHGAG